MQPPAGARLERECIQSAATTATTITTTAEFFGYRLLSLRMQQCTDVWQFQSTGYTDAWEYVSVCVCVCMYLCMGIPVRLHHITPPSSLPPSQIEKFLVYNTDIKTCYMCMYAHIHIYKCMYVGMHLCLLQNV